MQLQAWPVPTNIGWMVPSVCTTGPAKRKSSPPRRTLRRRNYNQGKTKNSLSHCPLIGRVIRVCACPNVGRRGREETARKPAAMPKSGNSQPLLNSSSARAFRAKTVSVMPIRGDRICNLIEVLRSGKDLIAGSGQNRRHHIRERDTGYRPVLSPDVRRRAMSRATLACPTSSRLVGRAFTTTADFRSKAGGRTMHQLLPIFRQMRPGTKVLNGTFESS